jgi:glucokinase
LAETINMNDVIIAGADIGGSHITVALIDISTGKILDYTRKRREINTRRSAEEIFNSWSGLIRESFKSANRKPSKIGIAMPGPFDYANGISYIKDQNKYDALYGVNIKEKLAEKLNISIDNISFQNDAACFLQGEVIGGAGKGFQRVMGLTLGTGLGSARLLEGETEDASLWCTEYKGGIAEDYLSTRWFLKRYKEVSEVTVKNVKELVGKMNKNTLVQQIFDEFGENLAGFLIPYIEAEKLKLVILGGNISLAYHYFSQALKRTFEREQIKIEIRTADLGENAALIGAASSHQADILLPDC